MNNKTSNSEGLQQPLSHPPTASQRYGDDSFCYGQELYPYKI